MRTVAQINQVFIYEWLRRRGGRDGIKLASTMRKTALHCDTCGRFCIHDIPFTSQWVTIHLETESFCKYRESLFCVLSCLYNYYSEWTDRAEEDEPFLALYTDPDVTLASLSLTVLPPSTSSEGSSYLMSMYLFETKESVVSPAYSSPEHVCWWLYMKLGVLFGQKLPSSIDIQLLPIDYQ